MKKNNSLRTQFLNMTLFPIIVLGAILTITNYSYFQNTMYKEVKEGLRSELNIVLTAMDQMYPGEYGLAGDTEPYQFIKGEKNLSDDFSFVDTIKEQTQIDISLYFFDLCAHSTIRNQEGNRIIGSPAHTKVVEDVFKQKREAFYQKVGIGDEVFFAYFIPLFDSKDNCIGMAMAGKPTSVVQRQIGEAVIPTVVVSVLMVLLASYFCAHYSSQIISVIEKINRFLKNVASGNLKTELDEKVAARQDELGEVGQSSLHVQKELRDLIEKDGLTKLYNRRTGEQKLRETHEKMEYEKNPYTVAIGDIDFFKKCNDTYGHDYGDYVLIETAKLCRSFMNQKGYVARWGGEEFLFVFERMTVEQTALHLEELRKQIENKAYVYDEDIRSITMTFGAAEATKTVEENIKEADNQLYFGKEHGRNQVSI